MRILLGGVVAGLVVFVFSAVDHMVLPTGHMGLQSLPNEEAVLSALRANIRQPGLYFFPGMEMSRRPSEQEQKAWLARYTAGPTGLLDYHPGGEAPMTGRQLALELTSDVLAGLIAAFVVSRTAAPFGRRVVLVALIGLFGWLSISVSYWIWYGFPGAFVVAEGIDQVGGWLLGGVALAAIFRGR